MNKKSRLNFPVVTFILCFGFICSCYANEQNLEDNITVNCCLSIGQTCKTTWHMQKHGKRFQASPLDWMRDYSLDTCLHLFKTKFSDFFEEIKEVDPWIGAPCRSIKDTKNNILSIHHFSYEESDIRKEQERVRNLMLNRARKIDDILEKSDSIALVYHQYGTLENENLITFIKEFAQIYKDKKIYIINVVSTNIEGIKREVIFEEENLKIIQFSFLDESGWWTGNDSGWEVVMNYINLVKKQ